MYQLLVTLGHLMIFSGAKRLDLWLSGATKGISMLIKLPFWGLQKGFRCSKMDQLCLSSNAWPVCRLWNQIWCNKDIQRVKSALYGVCSYSHYIPYNVGACVWNWILESILYKTYATDGCIRLTQAYPYYYSTFFYNGLVWLFLILDISPLWGSV